MYRCANGVQMCSICTSKTLVFCRKLKLNTSDYGLRVMLVGHSPTVDRDWPILAELLFCFMYLANEVDEALS